MWGFRGSGDAIGLNRWKKNPRTGLSPFRPLSRDAHTAIVCNLCPDRHRWRSLLCLILRSSFRSRRLRSTHRGTPFSKRGFSLRKCPTVRLPMRFSKEMIRFQVYTNMLYLLKRISAHIMLSRQYEMWLLSPGLLDFLNARKIWNYVSIYRIPFPAFNA